MKAFVLLFCLMSIHTAENQRTKRLEQSTQLAVTCPVMKNRQADGRFTYVYRGRTYYFCCEDCVIEFKAKPEPFLSGTPNGKLIVPSEGISGWFALGTITLSGFIVSLGLFLVFLVHWRVRGRPSLLVLGVVLVPSLFAAVEENRRTKSSQYQTEKRILENEARETFNYAVTHDFGNPPVPAKPPLPPRLSGVYYRGNDERTDHLWNNGYYRTCTFRLALESADGRYIKHGNHLPDGDLFVRLDILRSPHTTEHFWTESVMNTMFLSRQSSALDTPTSTRDRVRLTTVKPRWEFTVRFPLGRLTGTRTERLAGIVYIGEAMSHRGLEGMRHHAAIQYELLAEEGVIQPASDLWMGALYRTRRLPQWKLPLDQWFSHEPIPELPGPHQTKDATALGIADYQHKLDVPAQQDESPSVPGQAKPTESKTGR